jgi:shikimate dehydrogenase
MMKQYGLIGFPLGHSFSKRYFTEKFDHEGITAQYDLYPLSKIEDFESLKGNDQLCGINVTIPYKEQIFKYLDEVDETAAQIGAVNVIKFIRAQGGLKLKGYNSDAIGFEQSIQPLLQPHHTKALILGTGGASKAIDYALRKMGLETTFVSRTARHGVLSYEMLNSDIIADYHVIVNASPVGTFPAVEECPNIPYQYLTAQHLLYDAVYNPSETLFLKRGWEQGAKGINGEAMLIGQAEAAWKIWNE